MSPKQIQAEWSADAAHTYRLRAEFSTGHDKDFWLTMARASDAHAAELLAVSKSDESGSWEADEILGWTEDREDAQEAAELLLKAVA